MKNRYCCHSIRFPVVPSSITPNEIKTKTAKHQPTDNRAKINLYGSMRNWEESERSMWAKRRHTRKLYQQPTSQADQETSQWNQKNRQEPTDLQPPCQRFQELRILIYKVNNGMNRDCCHSIRFTTVPSSITPNEMDGIHTELLKVWWIVCMTCNTFTSLRKMNVKISIFR